MSVTVTATPAQEREHHLSIFRAANQRDPSLTWDQRLELIKRIFPSVDMDWKKTFDRDIDVAGRILKDVLKADQADQAPVRPGPRPSIDMARGEPTVDRWLGRDATSRPYSVLPFHEAFALLVGERTLRDVSAKTGFSKSLIHRLLANEASPTGAVMEAVAKAFGKRPSYFLEYRIGSVAAAIMTKLVGRPDKSISAYEAIMHADPSQA